MNSQIKMLIMDVDGTLTDGTIYTSGNGELFKAFNVKDGMGIKIGQNNGIQMAIVTGRKSDIVSYRASELGIKEVHQNITDKPSAVKDIIDKYNLKLESVAYIGDDVNDVEAMNMAGLSFSPSDAVHEALDAADVVLSSKGGKGAVRECIDYIIQYNKGEIQ